MMKNFFEDGFTLAEVLITLGIIGVVATITIPNLMTSYKAHVIHKKLLKSYSVIRQVERMMKYDDIDPEEYRTNSKTPFYKIFIKYMSGATDCGSGYVNKCFSVWDTYSNAGWSPAYMDDGCIISADGIVYFFENLYSNTSTANPLLITVDINGYKTKPNKLGIDLFVFEFVNGEFKPYGAQGTKATSERTKSTYKVLNAPNYIKYLLKTVK